MEENTYIETIHRYLRKELNDTDMKEFKDKMQSDEQLRADVALEQKLLGGITGIGDRQMKADIAAVQAKLEAEGFFENASESASNEGRVVGFSMRRLLSIAAGLAIAVAVAWWALSGSETPTKSELFAQHYQPEQTELNEQIKNLESFGMVGAATADDSLQTALKFYKNGKYEEAIPALSLFLENHPQNGIAQFYFALSLLNEGKYAPAAAFLRPLTENPNFELYDEANWYRSLSLLQLTDTETEAIESFKKIANSDSKFKSKANSIYSVFQH